MTTRAEDLMLKFAFTDKDGNLVFNIAEPHLSHSDVDGSLLPYRIIGEMRLMKGGPVKVEWADDAYAVHQKIAEDYATPQPEPCEHAWVRGEDNITRCRHCGITPQEHNHNGAAR